MPRRNNLRRNTSKSYLPRQKPHLPELGARHPIVFDDALEDFFIRVEFGMESALYDNEFLTEKVPHKKSNYKLYDNSNSAGITIVERRLSAEYADRHRIKWTPNDAGRIRGEIQNELGRLAIPDEWPMKVTFDEIIRVGDADEQRSRKLALLVDQGSDVAEFLVREHEITMDGLGRAFRALRYPYDGYMPKFTVAALDRHLSNDVKNEAVYELRSLLPITAYIEPIRFTAHQDF